MLPTEIPRFAAGTTNILMPVTDVTEIFDNGWEIEYSYVDPSLDDGRTVLLDVTRW